MATVTEVAVEGFVHCCNPRCEGTLQRPARLIRQTTSMTYLELGGDQPHVERSNDRVLFVDDEDRVCGVCGGATECSEQVRPEYQMVHGNQGYLLEQRTGSEARQQATNDELREQVARLTGMVEGARAGAPERGGDPDEVASLKAELAAIRDELASKANKPGPKPRDA